MRYGDRIYLSIDIDYWSHFQRSYRNKSMTRILTNISHLKVPMYYKEEHHELIDHMNHFDYDTLINMDWHSDLVNGIANENLHDFNCGTWVNYIKPEVRESGSYVWIYPDFDCLSFDQGYCHDIAGPDPFKKKCLKVCGWKYTHLRMYRLSPEIWKRVIAIGICRSREYSEEIHKGVIDDFDEIAKSVGLNLRVHGGSDKPAKAFPKHKG